MNGTDTSMRCLTYEIVPPGHNLNCLTNIITALYQNLSNSLQVHVQSTTKSGHGHSNSAVHKIYVPIPCAIVQNHVSWFLVI